jgi:hypothetical protein
MSQLISFQFNNAFDTLIAFAKGHSPPGSPHDSDDDDNGGPGPGSGGIMIQQDTPPQQDSSVDVPPKNEDQTRILNN